MAGTSSKDFHVAVALFSNEFLPAKAILEDAAISLREFAERHRLRLNDKKLAQGYGLSWAEDVIPGRYGEIADVGDSGQFRLRLLGVPRSAAMSKALLARRRRAIEAGFITKWKGDAETVLYFDPTNPIHAELAIELVGARKRAVRTVTPEQRRALTDRLAAARSRRRYLPAETVNA